MVKPAQFSRPGISVERVSYSGIVGYVAWKPDKSAFCIDRSSLLKWLSWPPKTPTGDALREWLNDLDAQELAKKSAVN